MRKDAFYFPHDSNAKDDPKIVMLIEQLGLEGYGIYWVLVETLRDQPDYQYPLALLPAIARRYATTKDKVEIVVMNYGLFTVTEDGQFFLSPSLCRRMELYDQKKQRLSIAGKKGRLKQIDMGQARATPKQGPNIAQATPGQEKRREDKKREYSCATHQTADAQTQGTPFDLFWKSYPKKKSKIEAMKAWKQMKADSIAPVIMAAVEAAKVSDPQWTKDGGQFIPYPASWLRAGGWEDETLISTSTAMASPKGPCELCANSNLPACRNATQEHRDNCKHFTEAKAA